MEGAGSAAPQSSTSLAAGELSPFQKELLSEEETTIAPTPSERAPPMPSDRVSMDI